MAKKKSLFNPKKDKTIQDILEDIETHEVEVRFEKGNFKTSDCLVEGKKVLILNRTMKRDQMIDYLRTYLEELAIA